MKKAAAGVIAIQSSVVITTLLYALLVVAIFCELDIASGEKIDLTGAADINNSYTQQLVDASCKSSCPDSAELCIFMCS